MESVKTPTYLSRIFLGNKGPQGVQIETDKMWGGPSREARGVEQADPQGRRGQGEDSEG